ncbi:MAG: GtrA family protein [Clostridia bacterium]|nr:GtrA family protein [Clostridia bacterium]
MEEKKVGLIAKIKMYFEKHKTLAEIIRFLIVGGVATIIDFVMMGVVLYLFDPALYPSFWNVFVGSAEPSVVATIVGTGAGFVAGLIFNYIFSIIFVYDEKGNSKSAKGFVIFALLSLVGLFIHLGGMWLGFDVLGINEWIVKIVLTFVVLVYNYVSKRLIIFKKKEEKTNEE